MCHISGKNKQDDMLRHKKKRSPNLYKTAVSYRGIFVESEHVAPLCTSKRKKNRDTLYCPAVS